jgi:hypothetical protein
MRRGGVPARVNDGKLPGHWRSEVPEPAGRSPKQQLLCQFPIQRRATAAAQMGGAWGGESVNHGPRTTDHGPRTTDKDDASRGPGAATGHRRPAATPLSWCAGGSSHLDVPISPRTPDVENVRRARFDHLAGLLCSAARVGYRRAESWWWTRLAGLMRSSRRASQGTPAARCNCAPYHPLVRSVSGSACT